MKYLFVDNFRGFAETLLPVKDVNFFVGENSTGKTSILALIKLLSSPYFWFEQRFYTDEVKLGMFKDIVSVSSPDKSYFSIGFADIPPKTRGKDENGDTAYGFLCTFGEEDGSPILNHYTTIIMGEQFHVHVGRRPKYKSEGSCQLVDNYEFIKNLFLGWSETHKMVGSGYASLKAPFESRQALLVYLTSFLESAVRKKRGITLTRKYPRFYIKSAFGDVVWLAPIRTRPLRTYDTYRLDFSPEGEHTPYLIKKLLTRRTPTQLKQSERFIKFIEQFGKDSGLFRSISIKDYDRRTTTSPFELDIILAKEALSMDNVGYGVSQALPVIVELFVRQKDTWFTIQQPEIHLHPRAQAALGDVIYELSLLENKRFVIETHSDFTIDGFRLHYKATKTKRRPDAQIVFFERSDGGNNLYNIAILANGDISDNQPPAYREFFIKEQTQLLGL